MRTKLDSFCQQFAHRIGPLQTPLELACAAVEASTPGTPGRELLPVLQAARRELAALRDKVAEQQAYVLIFGPLKSGKSTLMNAIAGAYVSEVSSLPAYPCLVFVGAGQDRRYTITRYDGSTASFGEPQALARAIDEAHAALATAIRAAEQRELAFDPETHLPVAIRRVDVALPGTDLARSGAVLVDTPGLYTRMRFGYDRLTRDFRDAAACAVFVVKSDTLFLEQVFAEFQELLDLFSRVFLVVNVDSGKRDVGPDGSLVPSLEQSRPDAILQAFRQLAMPAPLHRAAAEGRVRLFAVDLLAAAAAVLQRRAPPADFAAFHGELDAFLGSDEYLLAFRRDATRRADRLLHEVTRALASDDVQALDARLEELRSQLEFTQAELDLVARALQRDFTPAFARAERALLGELERTARDAGQTLLRALGASIDTWFLSGHSLHWLLHDHWRPLLAEYRAEVAAAGHRTLEQCLQPSDAGLDLPAAVVDLCDRRGIDLHALRRAALSQLGTPPEQPVAIPVDREAIPLRKGLFDVLAFRSRETVRTRLFGAPQRPDRRIPQQEKVRHLGEAGRLHLHQCVTVLRANLAAATVETLQRHSGEQLRQATVALLRQQLQDEQEELHAVALRRQREVERLQALRQPLHELQLAASTAQQQLASAATGDATGTPSGDAAARERPVGLEPTVLLDPQPRDGARRPAGQTVQSDDRR